MTEREACERIVADGNCVGVLCRDCPQWGVWACEDVDEVPLAKMWLRLHPCEKKLVFSAEKFYADESIPEYLKESARLSGWPERCEGKTKEECNALGYEISDKWMEEKEMGYEEKQVEWLKMNNLREGSRVYVYRKAEDYEDGWRYAWVDGPMDEMVGKVAYIEEIHLNSLVVNVGVETCFMPYTALRPVGVTEFEVGRRYKYVGDGGAREFESIGIDTNDAEVLGRGCELMVEEFNGLLVKFTVFSRGWSFTHTWEDFVALQEKDYYKELDRWIKTHDLKVGDKVRLLRSPTLEDMEGWECDWEDWFDGYIGKPLTVVGFDDWDNDIKVRLDEGHYIYVPYTVLEKVEHVAYPDLAKALESVGITILETARAITSQLKE